MPVKAINHQFLEVPLGQFGSYASSLFGLYLYPTLTGSQLLLVESGSYWLNPQILTYPSLLDHLQQEMVKR